MIPKIDVIAEQCKIKSTYIKVVFFLITFIVIWVIDTVERIILLVLILLAVRFSGISLRIYLKILSVPVIFITLSSVILVIAYGLEYMLEILIRTITSFALMSFFITSITISEIYTVLKKMRFPTFLLEILVISYRIISVLLEEIYRIRISQELRNGYSNIKRSLLSLTYLIFLLLIRSINKTRTYILALNSRYYTGKLPEVPVIIHRKDFSLFLIPIITLILKLLEF